MNKGNIISNIIFYSIAFIFFSIFFKVLGYVDNYFYTVESRLSDILIMFVLLIVCGPLSVFLADRVFKIIKSS